jgi:hypothetical protein
MRSLALSLVALRIVFGLWSGVSDVVRSNGPHRTVRTALNLPR